MITGNPSPQDRFVIDASRMDKEGRSSGHLITAFLSKYWSKISLRRLRSKKWDVGGRTDRRIDCARPGGVARRTLLQTFIDRKISERTATLCRCSAERTAHAMKTVFAELDNYIITRGAFIDRPAAIYACLCNIVRPIVVRRSRSILVLSSVDTWILISQKVERRPVKRVSEFGRRLYTGKTDSDIPPTIR